MIIFELCQQILHGTMSVTSWTRLRASSCLLLAACLVLNVIADEVPASAQQHGYSEGPYDEDSRGPGDGYGYGAEHPHEREEAYDGHNRYDHDDYDGGVAGICLQTLRIEFPEEGNSNFYV